MLKKIKNFTRQFIYMMIGVPDYESYLEYHRQHHPEKTPMSYVEYFRNRELARYSNHKHCC